MATAHDVAKYILKKRGPMSAMKMQKLVYYSQAWHLVWDDEPLFKDNIEAWANGPVCPKLYRIHRGSFQVTEWPHGKSKNLSKSQKETVDVVLDHYGDKTAAWLSELTHNEDPWRDAREGLKPGERGNRLITTAAMHMYYLSLV